MNAIQLTDEHKSKLLEMCEALFCSDNTPYIDKNNNIVVWNLAEGVEAEYSVSIYWFEFCMTYLCEKILNPNPDKPARNLADKFKMFFWETNLYWSNAHLNVNPSRHPIDYLYEEFKKL